jgi:hypothetical protein
MTKKRALYLFIGGVALYYGRGFIVYGLLNERHLLDIIDDVVRVVGGGENAKNLLIETAQIESKKGTYPYNPFRNYGLGVFQFDRIGFEDTQARTSPRLKKIIRDKYNIYIDNLSYYDLRFSPLYGAIFARLKYYLVPEKIPDTIQGRALYWYKYYNGGGAGTQEEAIKKYLVSNGVNYE